MKTFLTRAFILLIVATSGLAFAAQGDVLSAAPEPAVAQSAVDTTTVATTAAELPQNVVAQLDILFPEVVQQSQGACCVADCRAELTVCKSGCGLNQACLDQCVAEFSECADGC